MVVHPSSHRVSRVRRYSGSPLIASSFKYGTLTLYGRPSHAVLLDSTIKCRSKTPKIPKDSRFGLFRVRSPLLAESRLMSFPAPTSMFQFRAFPPHAYLIQHTVHGYCPCVFPHSEISGSQLICSSPKLIAACHVLLRLLMPRHSPCALISLTWRQSKFHSTSWLKRQPHPFRFISSSFSFETRFAGLSNDLVFYAWFS